MLALRERGHAARRWYPEFAEVAQANIPATKEMAEAGVLIDSAPLHRRPSAKAILVKGCRRYYVPFT